MRTRNNFNSVAILYDRLSRLVFGQNIKDAQINSLKYITPGSSILIAGGGTGWILEEVAKAFPSGLNVTYVDKSCKMIELSRKRNYALNKVIFLNDSIENIDFHSQEYDIIFTPFFLDCFSQQTFQDIFKKLNDSLKVGGHWINIDFYLSDKSSYWQKILVRIMYIFFRLLCNIEAIQLPYINDSFSNYKIIVTEESFKRFILTQVFQKTRAC